MTDLFTVTSHSFQIFDEKKSSFIAHLFPFDSFQSILESLQAEHPKARHFVSASRCLNGYGQVEESFSDDGEPKGTSGMPTLKVLQGNRLIDVGIITVRYFGGIKLGTGGLVRAYSDAANLVISEAEQVPFIQKEELALQCGYSDFSRLEYQAEQHGINFSERIFETEGIRLVCQGDCESLGRFKAVVSEYVTLL